MLSIEHLRGRDGIEFGKRAGTIFTLRNAATHCILSMSLLRPGLVEGLLEHGVCVEEAHAGLTDPTSLNASIKRRTSTLARAHCELQARQDDSAAARAGLAALVDLGSTQRRSDSGATPSSSATARNGATRPAAERAAADLLAAFGVELDAEHLREMPRRVAQALRRAADPEALQPDHLSQRRALRRAGRGR
jgi:hypothetical protein